MFQSTGVEETGSKDIMIWHSNSSQAQGIEFKKKK
jgi:hypothetical protein